MLQQAVGQCHNSQPHPPIYISASSSTSDTANANSDPAYKKISRATLAKCIAIWNKTSRSTACADVVREKLNTCFVVPNATRWNSFYDSVNKIREILEKTPDETMQQVFVALEVTPLSASQVNFIKEYCLVMQPLACALDILQGERNMYIGYLLPTLVSLELKLKSLKPTLKHAGPLADAVLDGIAKRFTGYFDRSELIMASITLPQFKLRWLDEGSKERGRSLLYSYARAMNQQQLSAKEDGSEDGHSSQEDDFFLLWHLSRVDDGQNHSRRIQN